jgi:glutamate-1-semialdehyde aminotransferase
MHDGIFIDPGLRMLVSAAHTQEDVDMTLRAFNHAFERLQ